MCPVQNPTRRTCERWWLIDMMKQDAGDKESAGNSLRNWILVFELMPMVVPKP